MKKKRELGYQNEHHILAHLAARTPEQRAADISRIVEQQGKLSWVLRKDGAPSELEYALSLAELPENKRGTRLNAERIAVQLNEKYHNNQLVRTKRAVAAYLSYQRCK